MIWDHGAPRQHTTVSREILELLEICEMELFEKYNILELSP